MPGSELSRRQQSEGNPPVDNPFLAQGLRMNSNRNSFTDVASAVSAEKRNHHATAVECADTAHTTTCLLGLLFQLMRMPWLEEQETGNSLCLEARRGN